MTNPIDAATVNGTFDLEAFKEEIRRQCGEAGGQPATEEERRRFADAAWARKDPEVQRLYFGQWVVPLHGHIVAHGQDLRAVLDEAARATGLRCNQLPIVAIDSPFVE